MFTFNPEMATDDMTEEGEAAFDIKGRQEEEEEEEVSYFILSLFRFAKIKYF